MTIHSMFSFDDEIDLPNQIDNNDLWYRLGVTNKKTGLQFNGTSGAYPGRSLETIRGRKCITLRNLSPTANNTTTAPVSNYFLISSLSLPDHPKTGRWTWGMRMLTGTLFNGSPSILGVTMYSAGYATVESQHKEIPRFPLPENGGLYLEFEIDWTTNTATIFVNGKLHFSYTFTAGIYLCYFYIGAMATNLVTSGTASYAIALHPSTPASFLAFTDFYFRTVTPAEMSIEKRVFGSIKVTPLKILSVVDAPLWVSTDPNKSILNTLNDPVLVNLSNLNTPAVVGDHEGRPGRFLLDTSVLLPQPILAAQVKSRVYPQDGSYTQVKTSFKEGASSTPELSADIDVTPMIAMNHFKVHTTAPDGGPWTVAKMSAATLYVNSKPPEEV